MKRRRIHGGTGIATVLIAAGLLAPAGASAAPAAPGVTTGAVANKAQTTATLTGRVDPNELETTYTFEYGTTRVYGSQVPAPPASAGSGASARPVTADIAGLAPATTYHYRLVASNSKGVRRGSDRTFKTQAQPLGLTLAATPNPLRPGSRTLISGQLSGTGNADRRIVLQSNPFPYAAGFQNASDVHLTNADGTFSFPILSVLINTQYRVVLPNVPSVQSPIVAVGVAPKVSVRTKRVSRTARSATFRFSGSVTPAHDGVLIQIQRRKNGSWVKVANSVAKHRSTSSSRYSKRVRLRRGGTFRVYAGTNDGDHIASASRSVRVRVR